jgi:arylsulfatase A-like enzyme
MIADRPNILFLLFDHQLYYRHGWDGGPSVRRPHFDSLKERGILFNRAYTVAPLCSPSRRSMLTGLYPHRHGEIKNDINVPFGPMDNYLDILSAGGYRCVYYGKWHAGPDTARERGCEGISYPSYGNPYTTPEYGAYLMEHNLPFPEVIAERVFWASNATEGEPYRQTGALCNEHMTGILRTPKETHEAFYLAHLACGKLRELANSRDGKPFHLRVDFWGPHQPYFPTQEYLDMYNQADIPVYGNFRNDLTDKPDTYRLEANAHISKDRQLIRPNPLDWEVWQEILSRAYAHQTLCDEAAGLILDALRETGLDENTLIVWSADHGDALACHGGHFDKGSYMPEEVLRIPMLLSHPGMLPQGETSPRIVSNLDIPATILQAAGLRFGTPVDGRSLFDAADTGKPWDNHTISQTHGHGEDVVGRALLEERYKYVYTSNQTDELYDLTDDPYELSNLAVKPEYGSLRTELRGRLKALCQTLGDGAPCL